MLRALATLAAIAVAAWVFMGTPMPDFTVTAGQPPSFDQEPATQLRALIEEMPLSQTFHLRVVDLGQVTTFQNTYGDTVCKAPVLLNNDQEYSFVFRVIERNGKAMIEGRLM